MTPEAASAWTAIGTAGGGRASVASTRSCGCQSAWLLRCPAGRRRPRRCACCHGGDGGRGCCPPCSHAYVRCGRGRPRPAARAHRLHSRCCQQTPEPANAPSCLVSNQRCAPCLWHLACARSTGWIPPPPVAPPETAAARQQLHSTNAIAQASAETRWPEGSWNSAWAWRNPQGAVVIAGRGPGAGGGRGTWGGEGAGGAARAAATAPRCWPSMLRALTTARAPLPNTSCSGTRPCTQGNTCGRQRGQRPRVR